MIKDKWIQELENIDKMVSNCNLCSGLVEKFNHNTTIHYGKDNSLLIVGEAPANNGWRKSGRCWYGNDFKITGSGKIMTNLLKEIDYELEDVFFVEAIKCFPISRNSLNKCKFNCYPFLLKQISIIKPKIILTMGDTATKAVLKDLKYNKFSDVVGKEYVLSIGESNFKVIPIYHPSPISPLSYKGNIDIFKKIIL
jgi:DNA polymerase